MFKLLVFPVLLSVISCEILGEPALHFDYNSEYASGYDNYQPRDYHFNYAVSDPHTGDHKSQWEVKDKGVVRGGYSLLEPDGTTRIVEYIADHHGFRAVVKKLGTSLHPESITTHGGHVEPEIQPIQVAQPLDYHSYDGHVDNYANVLGAAVQHLEPLSYQQPIEIPHSVELHGYQNLPIQQHQPILQNQLPIQQHEQIQPLIYKEQVPLQGYELGELAKGGDYGVLNNGHYKILAQPQAVGYQPLPYQSFGHQEVPIIKAQHQELSLGHQAIPVINTHELQGVSLGHQEAPIINTQQHEVPILGGYAHSSQNSFSLTGNPEDDARYSNYDESGAGYSTHQGAYSEKVVKIVAAPSDKDSKKNVAAEKFVIYYPEQPQHK